MIDWLAALFLVVGFLVIMRMTGLVAMSQNVIAVASRSASVVSDKLLDDGTKERELQDAAKKLFGLFPLLLFATVAMPVLFRVACACSSLAAHYGKHCISHVRVLALSKQRLSQLRAMRLRARDLAGKVADKYGVSDDDVFEQCDHFDRLQINHSRVFEWNHTWRLYDVPCDRFHFQ